MSKINCPNCNQKISDKAEQCKYCGFDLNKTKYCPECGLLVKEDALTCPECGCSFEEEKEEPKAKKPLPRKTIMIVAGILALIVLIAGFFIYRKASYYRALDQAIATRSESVEALYGCAHLIMDVWEDAILQERNENTEKYTCPDGKFVAYNAALDNLYQDEAFAAQVEMLDENQKRMSKLRKKLENPPQGEEDYNSFIIMMIDNFVDSTSFVLSPSGSIFDVKERFKELIEEGNSISDQLSSFGG